MSVDVVDRMDTRACKDEDAIEIRSADGVCVIRSGIHVHAGMEMRSDGV